LSLKMLRVLTVATVAAYLIVLAACRKPGSIYCFALVTPFTSEPRLLAAQYLLNVGIFQCDGWDVISNVSAEVLLQGHWEAVDGVKSNFGIVDTELFVKQVRGPPGFDPSDHFLHTNAKHLANTPVFQKVWDKVFGLGKWQDYEWTIKLDVDAVPLPLRLHDYLKNRPQRTLAWDPKIPGEELPYKAEYLYNARHDMYGNFLHGPAEAVSRGAMLIFRRGHEKCKKTFPPMDFGEDFYLNKCLELLGIPSVKATEVPLLYDTYEWGEKGQKTCFPETIKGEFRSKLFAVYHAHKTITEWLDCYAQAKSGPTISKEMRRLAIEEASRRPGPRPTVVTTTTRTIPKATLLNYTDPSPAAPVPIVKIMGSPEPWPKKFANNNTTTSTATTRAMSVHTTEVMVLAGAQSTAKVTRRGWMVRLAGQVWPLVSLLVACFLAVPFYGIGRRRRIEGRDSEADNRHGRNNRSHNSRNLALLSTKGILDSEAEP